MSKLRSINTSFWSDPWIEELTPEEKLLFIYLITNEKTNMLGIYEASIKKISFETGLLVIAVKNALELFERVGKVKYIDNHIVLVNFMKHQNYNTNMKKSAIDIYNSLPKTLKDKSLKVDKSNPSKGFETLLNHFAMVRKVEVEYEVEEEIEDEDEKADTYDNVLVNIETNLKNYLAKEKLVKAVIENNGFRSKSELEAKLKKFNQHLASTDQFSKTWKDYTTHFLNWNKKNKASFKSPTDITL